jgi:hypothetical protein
MPNPNNDEINEDYIKWCLSLTPEKRMQCLEKLNEFLDTAMPLENKEIARKLKEEGF